MPEDLLTSLPVAPELLMGGLVLLILFMLLRRIVRRGRRGAERAGHAAHVPDGDEIEAGEVPEAEAAEVLPNILYPMPVMSLTETRVLDALEDLARADPRGHRVLAQLSLNTFLYGCSEGRARAQDPATIRQLAALQVDFLVVDAEWRPVVALDLARDDFSASPTEDRRLTALERAGIAHLAIGADGLSDALRDKVMGHMGHVQGVAAE